MDLQPGTPHARQTALRRLHAFQARLDELIERTEPDSVEQVVDYLEDELRDAWAMFTQAGGTLAELYGVES